MQCEYHQRIFAGDALVALSCSCKPAEKAVAMADDYSSVIKLKMHEDTAMKIVEAMPRIQQLIMLKYLPVVLGRRESRSFDARRDLDHEIKVELEK